MQYIPPLVFSAIGLVDPAITALLSWMIGVEGLPSLYSWAGGAVVMTGVGIISYGEHERSKKEKAEKDATALAEIRSNLEMVPLGMELEESVHGE